MVVIHKWWNDATEIPREAVIAWMTSPRPSSGCHQREGQVLITAVRKSSCRAVLESRVNASSPSLCLPHSRRWCNLRKAPPLSFDNLCCVIDYYCASVKAPLGPVVILGNCSLLALSPLRCSLDRWWGLLLDYDRLQQQNVETLVTYFATIKLTLHQLSVHNTGETN
jgi:hypothetical protein